MKGRNVAKLMFLFLVVVLLVLLLVDDGKVYTLSSKKLPSYSVNKINKKQNMSIENINVIKDESVNNSRIIVLKDTQNYHILTFTKSIIYGKYRLYSVNYNIDSSKLSDGYSFAIKDPVYMYPIDVILQDTSSVIVKEFSQEKHIIKSITKSIINLLAILILSFFVRKKRKYNAIEEDK